ncbi:MAG: group III truncated hemoglobin [Opitutaceae bacterium]|nr:group III truncated hemoglobin [Cytophagales bacterium]
MKKSDIRNREDIILFVNRFYDKVNENNLLSPIFNEVAQIDWEKHLPVMYDFWENVIFATGGYKGNPLLPHLTLNQKTPLLENHFSNWKQLFISTIDELYEGPAAERTKASAQNIASVMQFKTEQMRAAV